MKNFYFVGCSMTYGQDLTIDERQTISFPALISKHHNATFVNEGRPGGTNQRTVSKVLQNINRYDHMYIQWIETDRFTMYNPKNWHEVNFGRLLGNTTYQNCDYYKVFGKYYYGYWSSILFEFKAFLEQIVMLQSVLALNNQSYLFWCAGIPEWKILICDQTEFIKNLSSKIDISKFDDDMILQQYHEIQNLYKLIDFKKFITPEEFDGAVVFDQFPLGPTKHSLKDGEQYIANQILNLERIHNESI